MKTKIENLKYGDIFICNGVKAILIKDVLKCDSFNKCYIFYTWEKYWCEGYDYSTIDSTWTGMPIGTEVELIGNMCKE